MEEEEEEDEEAIAEAKLHEEEALALVSGALDTLHLPPTTTPNTHSHTHAHTHPTYEAYTACVETLRGVAHALAGRGKRSHGACVGVCVSLRQTREEFMQKYLLPVEVWVEWVQDEATLPVCGDTHTHIHTQGDGGGEGGEVQTQAAETHTHTHTPEEQASEGRKAALKVLEEKALVDMPCSVTLRLLHIALLQDDAEAQADTPTPTPTPTPTHTIRAALEEAVAVAGMHFLEGHKLWEAYRDYELSLLPPDTDTETDTDTHTHTHKGWARVASLPAAGLPPPSREHQVPPHRLDHLPLHLHTPTHTHTSLKFDGDLHTHTHTSLNREGGGEQGECACACVF